MTDDKDKATELVESVFGKQGSSPIYQTAGRLITKLIDDVAHALTTTRKEAREAAFRDAKDALQSPMPGTMASTHFHQGFEQMRHLGIVAIERAAANTQEGGGDG